MGLPYRPLFLKIEITRRCNLKCPMCYRGFLGEAPDMTFEQFKKIIDDNPNTVSVLPIGYGESLIHPEFMKMMEYAFKKGIKSELVTNGTLFTEDLIKDYMRLKPTDIAFSIDSPYKKEYEKIRRGAVFEKTINNLKSVIEQKNVLSPQTKIHVHMTTNIYNFKSINDMIKLCDSIGVDHLEIDDVTYSYEYGTSTEKESLRGTMKKEEIESIQKKFPETKTTHIRFSVNVPDYRRCHTPWTSIYIDVEGNVFPCTDNLNWNLGNVYEKSIKDIYNSEKMKKFRELSTTGNNKNCVKCAAWAPGKCPIVARYMKLKK